MLNVWHCLPTFGYFLGVYVGKYTGPYIEHLGPLHQLHEQGQLVTVHLRFAIFPTTSFLFGARFRS